MKKITTENKLIKQIMDYWGECAVSEFATLDSDFAINCLIDDYAKSCGIDEGKLFGDVDITVRNMTNSQKRKLYKLMLESNIKQYLKQ